MADYLRVSHGLYSDGYFGTPEALAAAGLLRLEQLPGRPGMRKTVVTVLSDGTPAAGNLNANCKEARLPGAKRIMWASKSKSKRLARISVNVSTDEAARRIAAHDREVELKRVAQVMDEARTSLGPAAVREVIRAATAGATIGQQHTRSHLRLVWSRTEETTHV